MLVVKEAQHVAADCYREIDVAQFGVDLGVVAIDVEAVADEGHADSGQPGRDHRV